MQTTKNDFNTWIAGIHNRHKPEPLFVDDYHVLPEVMGGIIVAAVYQESDVESHLECIDIDEFLEWVDVTPILDEWREYWTNLNSRIPHEEDRYDVEEKAMKDFWEYDCNEKILAEFLNKKNGIHK